MSLHNGEYYLSVFNIEINILVTNLAPTTVCTFCFSLNSAVFVLTFKCGLVLLALSFYSLLTFSFENTDYHLNSIYTHIFNAFSVLTTNLSNCSNDEVLSFSFLNNLFFHNLNLLLHKNTFWVFFLNNGNFNNLDSWPDSVLRSVYSSCFLRAVCLQTWSNI